MCRGGGRVHEAAPGVALCEHQTHLHRPDGEHRRRGGHGPAERLLRRRYLAEREAAADRRISVLDLPRVGGLQTLWTQRPSHCEDEGEETEANESCTKDDCAFVII